MKSNMPGLPILRLLGGILLVLICSNGYSDDVATANENPRQNFNESAHARGLDASEVNRRKAMVRAYFARQRAQLDIVATTVTDSGQVIDWIRPESQVGRGALASPPPDSPPGSDTDDAILSVSELQQQTHARGPKGTVPIVRRDVDAVIDNMTLPDSIDDLLSKYGKAGTNSDPDAIASPGEPDHVYTLTRQEVFNMGSSGYINLWNPYVAGGSDTYSNGEFSLGQVAIANVAAGDPQETIEAGWQDYPALYGDYYPHFFVFYTTNGYARKGDYIGGYNRDVRGFVQYSRTVYPGMRLTSTSVRDGTQQELFVGVKKWGSNWWIFANGQWVGYYPASLFDPGRLGTRATSVSWYGEVVDLDDGRATFTDMGSGGHAAEGYRKAAYMRNLFYYDQFKGAAAHFEATEAWETDDRCYSLATYFLSGSSWGSYFFWGGPGRTNYYTSECGDFRYSR